MDWTQRRERARALLAGQKCLYPASVYDPLSARIAVDLGYEFGLLAGSVASLTVLGDPDLTVITLSEFAEQALRINRAADLPLMVDADHGYGNALSVRRTVEELETAGVALLTIEDTLLPAAYGSKKTQLITQEEGVGKMRAAVDARRDPRLIIAARTSALSINGLDDVIRRARAYRDAGVDALHLVGAKTRVELDAVAEAVKLPIFVGQGRAEFQDVDYLVSRGVRICLQGHEPIRAAVQAVYQTLKAQREQGSAAKITGVAPAELMDRLSREQPYAQWTRDYLEG